jgi:hypothetical protein
MIRLLRIVRLLFCLMIRGQVLGMRSALVVMRIFRCAMLLSLRRCFGILRTVLCSRVLPVCLSGFQVGSGLILRSGFIILLSN